MAKGYYVQAGAALDYRNETAVDIAYGDVLVLGTRIGVAESDIPVGQLGAVGVSGVYQLPAATADVFAVGADVYWDAAAGAVTATEAGNVPCGFAAAAKTAGMVETVVKIG